MWFPLVSVRARIGEVTMAEHGFAVCLGMGVDWVCGTPEWARLQQPLVLMRARVGVRCRTGENQDKRIG